MCYGRGFQCFGIEILMNLFKPLQKLLGAPDLLNIRMNGLICGAVGGEATEGNVLECLPKINRDDFVVELLAARCYYTSTDRLHYVQASANLVQGCAINTSSISLRFHRCLQRRRTIGPPTEVLAFRGRGENGGVMGGVYGGRRVVGNRIVGIVRGARGCLPFRDVAPPGGPISGWNRLVSPARKVGFLTRKVIFLGRKMGWCCLESHLPWKFSGIPGKFCRFPGEVSGNPSGVFGGICLLFPRFCPRNCGFP